MTFIFKQLGKLPLGLLYILASFIYYLAFYIIRYRRIIVADNIKHAFPKLSEQQQQKLIKNYYRFLCDLLVEVMHSQYMSQNALQARIEFINKEAIQHYLDQQQSIQFLSIHQGNWEWVLQILNKELGIPTDMVYKPLHNEAFENIIYQLRSRFGGNLIPVKSAVKQLLKKRREFRGFIMAAEQAPTGGDRKYWTVFFNRPSSFFMGPQLIGELTQTPTVYIAVKRVKRGYYTVEFKPLCEPPYEKNSVSIIEAYIDAATQAIEEQKETWLWSNRKWKRQPFAEDDNCIYAKDFPETLKPRRN